MKLNKDTRQAINTLSKLLRRDLGDYTVIIRDDGFNPKSFGVVDQSLDTNIESVDVDILLRLPLKENVKSGRLNVRDYSSPDSMGIIESDPLAPLI